MPTIINGQDISTLRTGRRSGSNSNQSLQAIQLGLQMGQSEREMQMNRALTERKLAIAEKQQDVENKRTTALDLGNADVRNAQIKQYQTGDELNQLKLKEIKSAQEQQKKDRESKMGLPDFLFNEYVNPSRSPQNNIEKLNTALKANGVPDGSLVKSRTRNPDGSIVINYNSGESQTLGQDQVYANIHKHYPDMRDYIHNKMTNDSTSAKIQADEKYKQEDLLIKKQLADQKGTPKPEDNIEIAKAIKVYDDLSKSNMEKLNEVDYDLQAIEDAKASKKPYSQEKYARLQADRVKITKTLDMYDKRKNDILNGQGDSPIAANPVNSPDVVAHPALKMATPQDQAKALEAIKNGADPNEVIKRLSVKYGNTGAGKKVTMSPDLQSSNAGTPVKMEPARAINIQAPTVSDPIANRIETPTSGNIFRDRLSNFKPGSYDYDREALRLSEETGHPVKDVIAISKNRNPVSATPYIRNNANNSERNEILRQMKGLKPDSYEYDKKVYDLSEKYGLTKRAIDTLATRSEEYAKR